MSSLLTFLTVSAALLGTGFSTPVAGKSANAESAKSAKKTFTLEQVAIPRSQIWGPAMEMRKTYLKYGVPVPEEVHDAAEMLANGTNQASAPVRPVKGDIEYLMNVTVGNHVLSLDMDTGSSDLWVFSTLQRREELLNRPIARVYDTKGSGNGKKLEGHSWEIRYGDASNAKGDVYTDRVGVGGIFYENQAVEAAKSVSSAFVRDNANDGLLGLGFSKLNTIKPNKQKTWFDNVKPQLSEPVFTSSLKRRAVGSYDFGYIDKAKYKGEIKYVPVTGDDTVRSLSGTKGKGFWNFAPSGYAVGNGPAVPVAGGIEAIVDTGTSLWYLPRAVANAYWRGVPGATIDPRAGGWAFPCEERLPDMSMIVEGTRITVPGINMNYQTIEPGLCYGGIQSSGGGGAQEMPFSIFGDVFLKGVFVVFEAKPGATPRLGFAQQSDFTPTPQDTVAQDGSEPNPIGPPIPDSPFEWPSPTAPPPEEESPWWAPFGDDERKVNNEQTGA